MKKQKITLVLLQIAAVIFEILPYGAVLNFASPETEGTIRKTYSYFDLTPYGYANFGPFITAVLSCVLLILTVVFLFKTGKRLKTAINVIAAISFLTSLMPLLFGLKAYSVIGAVISAFLLAELCLSLYIDRKANQ